MSGWEHLRVEADGAVTTVTLHRPDVLNALNLKMGVELLAVLDELDADRSVRCVVLTGAGRAFCAGDDLRGLSAPGERPVLKADPIEQYVRGEGRWPRIVARMRALGKPVVVAVNGHAHGAGFNLALAGDLRLMAESATLAVPFVKRGLATGTSLLQQYVGVGKAMEWALLAPTLDAAEALRWGLVSRVVPDDGLAAETASLAAALAEGPTRVYGYTKAAVYRGYEEATVDKAYEHQGLALHLARGTADFEEGRTAFLEKRPPRFTGR
ncbi:MAG: enoyl-CoA hydratase/isomerase family protein [Acidimicrobiales bacterium]